MKTKASPYLFTPFFIGLGAIQAGLARMYAEAFRMDTIAEEAARFESLVRFDAIEKGSGGNGIFGDDDLPIYANLDPEAREHYVSAAESASRVYAGPVFILLNDSLQDLAGRVSTGTGAALRVGPKVNGIAFSTVLWAASNNFRHATEWSDFVGDYDMKFDRIDAVLLKYSSIKELTDEDYETLEWELDQRPSENTLRKRLQQLASIRPLNAVLERYDTITDLVSFDVLVALKNCGLDSYDKLQSATIAASCDIAANGGPEIRAAFEKAQAWAIRRAESLQISLVKGENLLM